MNFDILDGLLRKRLLEFKKMYPGNLLEIG